MGKWEKIAEIYKLFGDPSWDYSPEAMEKMKQYESKGTGQMSAIFVNGKPNGFYGGKCRLDFLINEWKKDIKAGLLSPKELYEDGKYPKWWLDKVLK